MKRIFKYELAVVSNQKILMQENSKMLCVQMQNGRPHLWVECEFDVDNYNRTEKMIDIYNTGEILIEVVDTELKYIGTFQMMGGALVYHVYERVEVKL